MSDEDDSSDNDSIDDDSSGNDDVSEEENLSAEKDSIITEEDLEDYSERDDSLKNNNLRDSMQHL
jgi:hypothetical protein